MRIRNRILVFIYIIVSTALYAQNTKSIPSSELLANTFLEQWNTDNGLITNKIIAVKQSLDGYIWLATYDGIIRFDGLNFDLYNASNIPIMEQDTYYQIEETSDSTLWFFSRGDGIINYKDGQFSKYQIQDSLPKSMRSIFIDSKERLWVAGFDNLFYVEDEKMYILEHQTIEGKVLKIAEDAEGNIYLGTDGEGVVMYDGENFHQFTEKDGLADDIIISLKKGAAGDVIVGTFEGISIINSGQVRTIEYTGNARINDIYVDAKNNILLGTDMGLYRINESEGIYEWLKEGSSLPTREINCIEIDHESNIWLGMERGGLLQLKFGNIKSYTTKNLLSNNRVNIVGQASEDEYWIGSDNGDIDVINTKMGASTHLSLKNDLTNVGIRDFLFDDKTTWIASYNGLLKIENGIETNYMEGKGLSSHLVRRIIRDSIGNIWVATRSGGINKINKQDQIEVFDRKNGLGSNYVLALSEIRGNIYAGTNRGGISIIKPDGTVETYMNLEDKLADAIYFNIREDSKGRIWLVSNNGLDLFDNGKFVKINFDTHIETKSIFDIWDDGHGSMWLTSSVGLLQISNTEIDRYLEGNSEFVKLKNYTDKDGLPSKECTAATRLLFDTKGNFWIPTNGGVGILNPEKVKENKIIPPVYIKSFTVDDENYSLHDVVVKPGKIRYTLGFTSLSYIAPENIVFNYKLDGLDNAWHTASGTEREIEYTNIPPGSYTFRVIATNNDGVWNEEGDELQFEVEPFIYQTIWFYTVLIFVFVIAFLLIARWRIARISKRNVELQKLNAELDSFVYSTSHDLRAPLSSVLGLINIAKMDDDPKQKNNYLNLMEKSIRKLDSFIHDIIDFSRNSRLTVSYSNFNISNLVEELYQELKYMDLDNLIEKKIELSGSPMVYGDIQRFKIVLNNLISNSLKYSDTSKEDSFIHIKVKNEDNFVEIKVIDNGIGISESEKSKIFDMFHRATENSDGSGIGLYIVKETIEKMNGTIEVDSTLGKGCTILFKIPLTNQY